MATNAPAEPDPALVALNLDIPRWEQLRDDDAIARLDEVLSKELMFRRADGSVVDKAAFMGALGMPSPFARRESSDIAVTHIGDRALATVTVTATRADGSVGRYRNIRVFFRRDGRWHLEVWFNDDMTSLPMR